MLIYPLSMFVNEWKEEEVKVKMADKVELYWLCKSFL